MLKQEGVNKRAKLSYGLRAFLTGADADTALEVGYEDLAVAYFAGARALDDGRDGLINELFVDRDIEPDLAQEIPRFLNAAVEFINTQLAPVTKRFRYCDQVDLSGIKFFFDIVKTVRLDDGCDEFHIYISGYVLILKYILRVLPPAASHIFAGTLPTKI
jgi:hypothetical protein